MNAAVAILIARQRTAELARGALPDSPVRPDSAPSYRSGPAAGIRRGLSVALRRLANRLEPSPAGFVDAAADRC